MYDYFGTCGSMLDGSITQAAPEHAVMHVSMEIVKALDSTVKLVKLKWFMLKYKFHVCLAARSTMCISVQKYGDI